jgi:hypothetical protein
MSGHVARNQPSNEVIGTAYACARYQRDGFAAIKVGRGVSGLGSRRRGGAKEKRSENDAS